LRDLGAGIGRRGHGEQLAQHTDPRRLPHADALTRGPLGRPDDRLGDLGASLAVADLTGVTVADRTAGVWRRTTTPT
jgi:hypothetical protein